MITLLIGAYLKSQFRFASQLLLLTACSLYWYPISGQIFRNLTDSDGISMSNTKSICQDKQGFMWFATDFGLVRFDSHELRRYKHSSKDSTSLSSNKLAVVFCDSKGNVWVGSTGGLDLYNRDTDNFTHIQHNLPGTNPELNNQIYFIAEDRAHRILVGTPFGLNSITVDHGKVNITYILHRQFEGGSQDIAGVGQAANGDFWAHSLDGLIHVPRKGGQPRLFRVYAADKSPLANEFLSAFMDDQDVIWLAPSAGGLVRFDVATETFTSVSDFRAPGGELPRITKIIPDKKGNFWIATYSGLAYFDPNTNKSRWSINQPGNVNSLADNRIQAMCFDQKGGIWLGTYYFGVSYSYPDSPSFFPWPSVSGRSQTMDYTNAWIGRSQLDNLWIIEENMSKLFLFDQSGSSYHAYDLQLHPSQDYYSFHIDKDNVLWAAGNAVLTRYDLKKKTYQNYPKAIPREKQRVTGRVYQLLEDSKGRFWLVGTFGALLFDKETGKFKKFHTVDYSLSILEDSRHNIWIGGGDEVFLLRPSDLDFQKIPTNRGKSSGSDFARVYRLVEDSAGRIWATSHQGLQLYEEQSNSFHLDDRIRLEKIEDLRTDRKGYLWLETNSELTRYHPDNGSFQTYGYQDGLPFNGISRPASSIADRSGTFYFATNKGIFCFVPQKTAAEVQVSPIFFTSLKLSGKEIKSGDSTGVLSTHIDKTRKLVLKYDQNIFSVDFALLSYCRSERNVYAYKLEGFAKTWVYTGIPSATYMNLPPGEYTFTVKAANGDGFWMKEQRRLVIVILPPWWRTWYAYLFYVLLLAATVYVVTRFFWLRNSFRKETALNQSKLDFFTNISHEIRTHLSLISAPLEKAYQQSLEEPTVRNYLTYAKNNSDRLMLLVNELLDFRKIQSGGVQLQVREQDVVKLINRVLAAFEHRALEKNIKTSFVCPDTPVLLWCDIAQMQKVFYNLLSNAYKFTPDDGNVSVHLAETANEVIITVKDSGKGISAEHLQKLFTYYYQADSDQPGYGIGLALSKSIVEQHRGSLTVESQLATEAMPGSTTLTVRLLRERYHFSLNQFAPRNSDYVNRMPTEPLMTQKENTMTTAKGNNTILIIEDNDELRAFIRELFDEEFTVLEAGDGVRGLELANEHIPDIILCDVMMPGVNGLEVCNRLKNTVTTAHTPVVLLTARTQSEQVIEGLTAGADDYLIKPFDPRILSLKINNLLRLRDELKEHYRQLLLSDKESGNGIAKNINEAFIERLKSSVIENLTRTDFGVNELATQTGMSVSVLYRKMRSLTGLTINEFIKAIRLGEAKKLLETGVYHVNEVATIVGFEDTKYFSKEFKKVFGFSPSELKNHPQTG